MPAIWFMRMKLYPTFLPPLASDLHRCLSTGRRQVSDWSRHCWDLSTCYGWISSCQPKLHLQTRLPDRFQMLPLRERCCRLPHRVQIDVRVCPSQLWHIQNGSLSSNICRLSRIPWFSLGKRLWKSPYWQNAPTISLPAAVFHTIHKLLTALYCTNANQLSKTLAHCWP